MKMDHDDFMNEVHIGELHEMGLGEVEDLLVDDMTIGVADIIAVPESPEDMDRPMTHKVMFMEVLTMNGKKHKMFFLPREAEAIEQAVAQYKYMLMKDMEEEAPEPIRDLLKNLNEVIRRLREDDE
jgi:hypothetical protein